MTALFSPFRPLLLSWDSSGLSPATLQTHSLSLGRHTSFSTLPSLWRLPPTHCHPWEKQVLLSRCACQVFCQLDTSKSHLGGGTLVEEKSLHQISLWASVCVSLMNDPCGRAQPAVSRGSSGPELRKQAEREPWSKPVSRVSLCGLCISSGLHVPAMTSLHYSSKWYTEINPSLPRLLFGDGVYHSDRK